MNGTVNFIAGKVTATRYHDFSCGHRVYGHESKCAHLHGHNYRVWFEVAMSQDAGGAKASTDHIGRVMDFSVIKEILCEWLETEWDHKMLMWENDPWAHLLVAIDPSVVIVPFNPTAESMAQYLVDVVAPIMFSYTHIVEKYGKVELVKCVVEETRKCMATYTKGVPYHG